MNKIFQKIILCGWVFTAAAVAQPPTEQLYLCPRVEGSFQNGQPVKSADGYQWLINIAASGPHTLAIKHWSSRSVQLVQNNYLLICQTTVNNTPIKAQLTVKNMNSCYVIPEVNYQIFGCFAP